MSAAPRIEAEQARRTWLARGLTLLPAMLSLARKAQLWTVPEPASRASLHGVALAFVLLAGIGVRALPGLFTSFPMGDGGLFAVMAADIQAEGWRLPWHSSYNGGEIPFTYPPLGLYVLAALSAILGQTPIQVMDWWAPLLTVASMGAAWLLLTELTDRVTGSWATAIFALMPRSFEWLIVGGGVTRALGFTLALLALWQLLLAVRRGRVVHGLLAGALGGLTVVTHPEATSFGVVSALALVVLERRRLASLGRALAVATPVAVFVVAPWLIVAVGRHGWEPYLAALGSHNAGWTALEHLLGLDTGTPFYVDPVKLIGAAGFLVLLLQRSWFVPLWYAGLTLAITGAGPTYAMLPFGIAVVHGARWLATLLAPRWHRPAAVAVVVVAVILAGVAVRQPLSPTRQVSDESRAAMGWIATNTPPESRFAILSGSYWWADTEAEWFPALTGRVSTTTVQGMEWLDEERWRDALDSHARLQSCADATLRCLAGWAARHPAAVDYVWRRGDATLSLARPLMSFGSGQIATWHSQPLMACPDPAMRRTARISPEFIDCRDPSPGSSFVGSADETGESRRVHAVTYFLGISKLTAEPPNRTPSP